MHAQKNTEVNNEKELGQSSRLWNSQTFLRVMALFSFIAAISALVYGITQRFWPLFILSAAFAIAAIVIIFTLTSIWIAPFPIKLLVSTIILETSFTLTAGIFSLAYGGPMAVIAIVIAFLFSVFNPTKWLNEWIIAVGLVGALGSAVLSVTSLLPNITNIYVNYLILALALIAILALIWLFYSGLIFASLRLKLIMGALALAVLPLIVLAIISLRLVQNTVTVQSDASLRIATELTVDELNNFFTTNLTSIETESKLPVFLNYLKLDPNSRPNSNQELELQATLNSLQTNVALYPPSYGLINASGINIYDTDANNIGKSEFNTDYFQNSSSTHAAYSSTVEFIPNTHESYIYFISPIFDETQQIIGFLRMSYDSHILQSELEKTSGIIGAHSYPILLDENGIRLADASSPNLIYHSILPLSNEQYLNLLNSNRIPSYIVQTQISSVINEIAGSVFTSPVQPYQFFTVDLQSSSTGILDTATYGTLATKKWYVVYLQEQSALVAAQKSLTQSTAVIAVLIAGIVAILIAIVSNLFTRPIIKLTETAETISGGNLDAQVAITTGDEIGILGKVFNSMTQQLKSSFDLLEKRVQERTQQLATQNDALQYRSRQLQTVADVARSVVSMTDMESLLTRVTTLISDRFNFYHVGIFLLDDKNEYAVLRASNSTGGQRMLSRQHKLKIGQVGIVGYVTNTGMPRIATDVGKDAVFFNNPDLPSTKSEMALPLKIENRVIGALDIQSVDSNAFSEEDIDLFTTLADQISIAINNNQLLENTRKALDESENLHRQYLNQEWSRRAIDAGQTSYKYSSQGLSVYDEELPEVKMVFETGRPVTHSAVPEIHGSKPFSTLAVPILLRGEVIGVIHLQENEESSFVWSENELVTVQTIADQLAQTLESARLFEQTIRRADRERRVLEITSKIRSTNDPQRMLEITLEELKRHLGATQAQIVINLPVSPEQPLSTKQQDSKTSK